MSISEKNYHRLFTGAVVLKALSCVAEIAGGIILAVTSSASLNGIILTLFGDEVTEHPPDRIWSVLFNGLHGISPQTQSLWAFLLLSHGIAKLIPSIGLIFKKMWAYPLSAVIFTGFVVYQSIAIIEGPSVPLEALTVFDISLIILIVHEYRHRIRMQRKSQNTVIS